MAGADNIKGKGFEANPQNINRAGRPKKLPDLDVHLIEVLGGKVNRTVALKAVLKALLRKALAGDVRSAELLLDRAYGKLKTSTSVELDLMKLSETQLDQVIAKLLNHEAS